MSLSAYLQIWEKDTQILYWKGEINLLKKYVEPELLIVTAKAKDDILLVSDVDIDVGSLYGDGTLN